MAIGVRASGSAVYDTALASGSPTTTVTKPAAAAAGDVAIVVQSMGWGGQGPFSAVTPAGWTAIATDVGSSSATSAQRTSAFYRVLQAGDSTWAFGRTTANSQSVDIGIVFLAFTGVDNTTPIDATGTTATNTGSATISAPAVTIATANAWHCIAMGCWNGGAASATGFTDLPNANPATHEQADLLYNQTPKSAGSTGAVTVTQGAASGNQLSAIPFALRPAGGGGGGAAANPPGAFPSIPMPFLAM
jgi:hypothetical protein